MQRHPARREVDSRPQWPQAAHVESARVVDPKCLKVRMLPVEYCYFMHTQMSTAVQSAFYKVDRYTLLYVHSVHHSSWELILARGRFNYPHINLEKRKKNKTKIKQINRGVNVFLLHISARRTCAYFPLSNIHCNRTSSTWAMGKSREHLTIKAVFLVFACLFRVFFGCININQIN